MNGTAIVAFYAVLGFLGVWTWAAFVDERRLIRARAASLLVRPRSASPDQGELYALFCAQCARQHPSALALAKRLEDTLQSDEWTELFLQHASAIGSWCVT